MTEATTGDAPTDALIAELINAAEGVRTAMYNSDLETSWRVEIDRWHAAVEAATRQFPAVESMLED